MPLKSELFFFAAVGIIFSIVTFQKNVLWGSEKGLWLDILQKSPSKARPHTNLGMAYDLDGNIAKAEDEYNKAIQLEPDYLAAYAPLAVMYGKRGDVDRAIEMFLWLIPRLPNRDPKAHTGLGVAYMIKGLLKDAEREFQEALKIDPNYEIAHYNLAEIYGQMGLKDEALKHYKIFIENAPPAQKELVIKIKTNYGL